MLATLPQISSAADTLRYCTEEDRLPEVNCGLLHHRWYNYVDHVKPRLCAAVNAMRAASCAQLGSVSFVQALVERAGLFGNRGSSSVHVYGPAAVHTIHGAGPSGLWQDPLQLATALIYLGARVDVRTYVEYGVWSCWTATFVSAYLQRVSSTGGRGFHGLAVDTILVQRNFIAPNIATLMAMLNVSFVGSNDFARGVHRLTAPAYDLCFIDAIHTYTDTANDYARFAGACRWMMFHDVNDLLGWLQPSAEAWQIPMNASGHKVHRIVNKGLRAGLRGGGTPGFWHDLATAVGKTRATTVSTQLTATLPMFGIGILAPNEKGDAGLGAAAKSFLESASPSTTSWHWLCQGMHTVDLCGQMLKGIPDAESVAE